MKTITDSQRADLLDRTHEFQRRLLSRGNRITEQHERALFHVASGLVDLACGRIQGRWAVGALPGFGKTATVSAFIAACIDLDLIDQLPVLVCQRTARALSEVLEDIDELLPNRDNSGDVNLYYSSERPADVERCRRSIEREKVRETPALLVTHSRVLTGEQLREFMEVNGVRRVVIFDESFLRAAGYGAHLPTLLTLIGGALAHLPANFALAQYLAKTQQLLEDARSDLEDRERVAKAVEEAGGAKTPSSFELVITLPELSSQGAKIGLARLREREDAPVNREGLADSKDLQELVELLPGQRVRLVRGRGAQTVLQWRTLVHPSIEDVLILDASYQIRQLCQMDATIKDAEKVAIYDGRPLVPMLMPLSTLIDYRNVRITWRKAGGGRFGMAWRILDARHEGVVCAQSEHLAEVLRRHAGERVAVITHREESKKATRQRFRRRRDPRWPDRELTQRDQQPVDFVAEFKADMAALGVDTSNVSWLTWGSVEGRNDARDCTVVYMAGVMMRDRDRDLYPTALGIRDDIEATVTEKELRAIEQSEAAHLIFQGALRCAARESVDGVARAAWVYVTHWHEDALVLVQKAMNGLPKIRREKPLDPASVRDDGRRALPKARAVAALSEELGKLRDLGVVEGVEKARLMEIARAFNEELSSKTFGKWLREALEVDEQRHPQDPWMSDAGRGTTLERPVGLMFLDQTPQWADDRGRHTPQTESACREYGDLNPG